MEKIPQEVYRRQRVMEYCRKHGNISEAARRYGYSRKTVHKWLKRWDGRKESLYDRSRAPHRKARGHSEQELRLIRRLAKKHKWQDIIAAYQEASQKYEYPYCYETFKRKVEEMRREKPVKRKRRKNKPYKRAAYPGQKVQVDVKYVPAECVTSGAKYYVYVAVDECSRWSYHQMYEEHSTYSSAQFLEELMRKAPFPIRKIQTDNGTEFTNKQLTNDATKKTLFEEKLKEYGILHQLIRIATPRHNGKVERQNRIDEVRFYSRLRMYSLNDGRKQLAVYQSKTNTYWKHCLGMKSPKEVVEKYLGVM